MNCKVEELIVKKAKSYLGRVRISRFKDMPLPKSITLNLILAKHSRECTEEVIVHEMVHLIQTITGHNKEFYKLMDYYLPKWMDYHEKFYAERLKFGY